VRSWVWVRSWLSLRVMGALMGEFVGDVVGGQVRG